jgi:hypothetical protein
MCRSNDTYVFRRYGQVEPPGRIQPRRPPPKRVRGYLPALKTVDST